MLEVWLGGKFWGGFRSIWSVLEANEIVCRFGVNIRWRCMIENVACCFALRESWTVLLFDQVFGQRVGEGKYRNTLYCTLKSYVSLDVGGVLSILISDILV